MNEISPRHWQAPTYPTQRVLPLRPVAARVQLKEVFPWKVGPPTEEEIHDAILLLAEPYSDDVGDEAFRILDEYGR